MYKVLFIGESWMVHVQETKGFDCFTYDYYEEATDYIKGALTKDSAAEFVHIPSHRVEMDFPKTAEELAQYDAVMVSDCGANTFNLPMNTFMRLNRMPNKLHMIRDYVANGGAFVMIGGYLTFSGIQARGAYKGTAAEEILPVELLPYDDRRENPQGVAAEPVLKDHPVLKGMPEGEWPNLLGYNKLIAKDGAEIVAEVNGDPLVVLGTYGKGRTIAFASDCAPHWCPTDFCEWEGYGILWRNLLKWAAGE